MVGTVVVTSPSFRRYKIVVLPVWAGWQVGSCIHNKHTNNATRLNWKNWNEWMNEKN
jgi:hypothetical protein